MGLFMNSTTWILSLLLVSQVKTVLSPQGMSTSMTEGETHVLESIYVPVCSSGQSGPSRPLFNQMPGFHITQVHVCFHSKVSNHLQCCVGKAFINPEQCCRAGHREKKGSTLPPPLTPWALMPGEKHFQFNCFPCGKAEIPIQDI